MKSLKYLIVGTGGTGAAVGAHLARAGFDVTFIARGEHLRAMQEHGLHFIKLDEAFTIYPIQATDTEHYRDQPDVIFVCVKYYSIPSIMPFLKRVSTKDTVIIPILNIFTTGSMMQPELSPALVTDGCIYVAAAKTAPGEVTMTAKILRLVFGVRDASEYRPVLKQVADDLTAAGFEAVLSDSIQREALMKFSYVSPHGVAAWYYGVTASAFQHPGEPRDFFVELVREVGKLAEAMGVPLDGDTADNDLSILDNLAPDMTTSMQKDIAAGGRSEIDGQLYEIVRLADQYGVDVPAYKKVAEKAHAAGLR